MVRHDSKLDPSGDRRAEPEGEQARNGGMRMNNQATTTLKNSGTITYQFFENRFSCCENVEPANKIKTTKRNRILFIFCLLFITYSIHIFDKAAFWLTTDGWLRLSV